MLRVRWGAVFLDVDTGLREIEDSCTIAACIGLLFENQEERLGSRDAVPEEEPRGQRNPSHLVLRHISKINGQHSETAAMQQEIRRIECLFKRERVRPGRGVAPHRTHKSSLNTTPDCEAETGSNASVTSMIATDSPLAEMRLGGAMRNVQMIRNEHGLVSIPLEKAVYCEKVSNSAWRRCGLCGSEEIVEIAPLFRGPSDPGPTSAAASVAITRLAA